MTLKPLPDAELSRLAQALESDRAERKQAWSEDTGDRVRQAVCAFANDLPNHNQPGVVLIGVRDNGAVAHLQVTDQLLQTLAHIKTDGKILPPPTLTVEKRQIEGADVAVLTVWPADSPPVSYDGRIWIRIGPRRGIATAQDERILSEKRRYKDRGFDTRPVAGCPLSELNRIVFENEYLPQEFATDVLENNGRTYEERLASLGMIASVEDPTPTMVGLLTVGKSPRSWIPGAYVQFLRIHGTNWDDPVVDSQEIDGTLDLVMRRLDDKIKATLAVSVDITSGSTTEIRTIPYPLSALQQLVRNAVMHRTYEGTNMPVRVTWFNDRIEITNPGGPFGVVTAENFGRPGINDYRNPAIATVLKTLGYVQRFGIGITEARRALKANGNPDLEFQVEQTIVMAVLRKAS